MKLTALAVLFATTILLSGAILTSTSVQSVDALKSQGVSISSYGSKTKEMVCGDRLCSEIPGGREAWEGQQAPTDAVIPKYGKEQKGISSSPESVPDKRIHGEMCNCLDGCACDQGGACICAGKAGSCMCGPNCACGDMKHGADGMCSSCGTSDHSSKMKDHGMKTITGTIQSETDPGKGHEFHQLAVLLAPSEKMYKGMLTYSASENVQLVALHGPLTEDEVMGQTIWTPDGETKFALTLVDQQSKMGSWMFTGNALAAHTFNPDPFIISYSVHYAKVSDGHGMHGSCDCAEGCACDQGGACICSGEVGPCMCGPNCTCGDMKHGSNEMTCNCSEDGTCSCGAGCNCAGPSPGSHGDKGCCGGDMKHGADGMCSSCGTSGHGSHGMSGHKMTAYSGTIQSETDPGKGHEFHQLAVLLPPNSDGYAGMLTYSASENVQLVALHGPLTEDEVMGQTIWTPDGETKFALTLVDQQSKMGSWMFTGNALAAHTFNPDPFAITYSVVSMGGASTSVHEKMIHGTTCDCAEGCACDQGGACICSGEVGPCMCGPDCNCGE
ncbi:hypothetical protein [Nitrosopumilus sp.]|uniref:hypothetical protein n=1 Tax=Nitrosopumilus sp. TaxID=2024843 RepID=UPI003B5AB713